jgi:hypothetical protein
MCARHGDNQERRESGNDEGLTMMTSALLTMIDRHDSSSGATEAFSQQRSLRSHVAAAIGSRNLNLSDDVYSSGTDTNVYERASPVRPPPGMTSPPKMSNVHPDHSSPPGGEGYFLGGYEEQPPSSPPWGLYQEDL